MKGRFLITCSDKSEAKQQKNFNYKWEGEKNKVARNLITDVRGGKCRRHSSNELYANCVAAKLNVKVKPKKSELEDFRYLSEKL